MDICPFGGFILLYSDQGLGVHQSNSPHNIRGVLGFTRAIPRSALVAVLIKIVGRRHVHGIVASGGVVTVHARQA